MIIITAAITMPMKTMPSAIAKIEAKLTWAEVSFISSVTFNGLNGFVTADHQPWSIIQAQEVSAATKPQRK
jgi:hypothetical protein